MTYAIDAQGLTRRFGRHEAVDGLELRVPTGSVFALVGPNGAGKTTTIKLLMNLIHPTRGSATVLGTNSRHLKAADFQRIGYVSENQRLPDWMTPVQLFNYCRPLYPMWDESFFRRLSADLDLNADTRLRALSRGTRMKAALLASLAYRPELVVLDEPFTGLDPVVRDELIRALLERSADRPSTVLISSHDLEELERLADWVGFIARGRLQFAEPVSSLLARFRLVEVIAENDTVPALPGNADDDWWLQGSVGRTLRFVDANGGQTGRDQQLAQAFPACAIRISPLSLREVFVALTRRLGAARSEEAR